MSPLPTVLVVDDEPDMREMLAFGLSQERFDVTTAADALTALATVRQRRFDVAITDLKMPGMDGREVLAALKRLDPDLEVVVATGYATVETAIECMKSGAYDFVRKPYQIKEISLLLTRALEKRRLAGALATHEASRALLGKLKHGEVVSTFLAGACALMGADRVTVSLDAAGTQPADLQTVGHGDRALPPGGVKLVVPLLAGGRTQGKLVVERGAWQPAFSAIERRNIELSAQQLAMALENAALFRELEGRMAELVATRALLIRTERLAAAGDLARGLAHEINSPLAWVRMNLEAMRTHAVATRALSVVACRAAEVLLQDGAAEAQRLGRRLIDAADATSSAKSLICDVDAAVDDALAGVGRVADLIASFALLATPLDARPRSGLDLAALVEDVVAAVPAGIRALRCELGSRPVVLGVRGDLRLGLTKLLEFVMRHSAGADATSEDEIVLRVMSSARGSVLIVDDPLLRLDAAQREALSDPRVEADSATGETMRLGVGMPVAYGLLARGGAEMIVAPQAGGETQIRVCFMEPGA